MVWGDKYFSLGWNLRGGENREGVFGSSLKAEIKLGAGAKEKGAPGRGNSRKKAEHRIPFLSVVTVTAT